MPPSSSTDGGKTWPKNMRLDDVTLNRTIGTWNNQYYIVVPLALVAQDGADVAVWSDTRNGDDVTNTQELYAAPVAYDTSTIPAGLKGAVGPGYTTSDLVIVGVVVGVAGLLAGAGIVMLLMVRRRRGGESAGAAREPVSREQAAIAIRKVDSLSGCGGGSAAAPGIVAIASARGLWRR